jgi:superfamily II DNA or RNA helicase
MFSEIGLARSYDSGRDDADIVADFLDPVLSQSSEYFRLAGYFNSGMLAAAARGMASFIKNGGKMRIVASPNLSAGDLASLGLAESNEQRLSVFEGALNRSVADLATLEDLIIKDHVSALAWMLKSGKLEIKIAVPAQGQTVDALFHHKVGILVNHDGTERLSFSGSINETSAAWTKNFEDFKVFREWVESEKEYFDGDLAMFEDYWDKNRRQVEIIDLPEAIERQILRHAPVEFDDLILKRHQRKKDHQNEDEPLLRDYQIRAVDAWAAEGFRGILAMATGTGKTKTAVGCISALRKIEKRLFIISTSPYQHIATQWTKELKHVNSIQLAGKANWKKLLQAAIDDMLLGIRDVVAVSVVQDTAANPNFLALVQRLTDSGVPILFIGDESHGLGAPSLRQALCEDYKYRLGLSATPARYFDEGGTDFLEDYFGGDVFSFPIAQALQWRDPVTNGRALCDYNYYPVFVDLSPDETEKYGKLTSDIGVATAINNTQRTEESHEKLKQLLRDRALILKQAEGKIAALQATTRTNPISGHTLVYCVNTKQLVAAGSVLSQDDVIWHRFTGDESTSGSPSEREVILSKFSEGDYGALVAMRCLDEGVDVPSAHTAFILASSGNPREFIQRRGRILRPDKPGKVATVFDFVVRRPRTTIEDPADPASFESEMKRMLEFASVALNQLEVRTLIIREMY